MDEPKWHQLKLCGQIFPVIYAVYAVVIENQVCPTLMSAFLQLGK